MRTILRILGILLAVILFLAVYVDLTWFPEEPGDYKLIAEIIDQNNNPVRSVRKIEIQ